MILRMIFSVGILLFSGVSVSAEHNRKMYGSIGYTRLTFEDPTSKFRTSILEARYGFKLNSYLAIEGRAGEGVTTVEKYIFPGTTPEIDNYYGLYLYGNIPLSKGAALYGFIGATKINIDGTNVIKDDYNDFSYGLGFKFRVHARGSIGVEYMNLYDGSSVDIKGYNVRYQLAF